MSISLNEALGSELRQIEPSSTEDVYNEGVFIFTNESESEKNLNSLSKIKGLSNTFIGVSCLSNLDIVSNRPNDKRIIILDVSPTVEKFWKNVKNLILMNSDRNKFITELLKDIKGRAGEYWGQLEDIYLQGYPRKTYTESRMNTSISSLISAVSKPTCWLSSNDKYSSIRKIFLNKGFYFIRASLTNEKQVTSICIALAKFYPHISLDLLYPSNIKHVLPYSQPIRDTYQRNINRLRSLTFKDSLSPLIHCKDPTFLDRDIHRQVVEKGTPLGQYENNLQVLYFLNSLGSNEQCLLLAYLFNEDFLKSNMF